MQKFIIHIIFILALSGNLTAQLSQPKTSAEYISLINKSKRDSTRIDLFFQLGKLYITQIRQYYSGPDVFADSAKWAFTTAIKLGDSLGSGYQWSNLRRLMGTVLFFKGDIDGGERMFMEVIDDCRKKRQEENEAFTWLRMAETRDKVEGSFSDIHTYLSNAMELYHKLGQTANQASVLLNFADLHLCMVKLDEAESESLQALDKYQQVNYRPLYNSYYMLSVINRYQGDLHEALFYAIHCVENVDSLQDKTIDPVIFYGELALVYDGLGLAEESSKWYRLTLEERKKRFEAPIIILRTAGLLIHQLVRIDKAKEALSLIMGIQKDYPPHDKQQRATITQYLGYCYQALGDFSKAENYFTEMIREFEAISPTDEFASMAYQDVGNFYLVTKRYDKAAGFLSKAVNPPSVYLVSRQRDIYLSLYTADSAMGNYLAAINDFRKYKMFTDSLFSETKSHQVEELQIRYQTEKKEKDIILLNTRNREQETEIQRAALIRNIIIAGVLLFAGFFYYRYRLKSISNKKMQAQQVLINQKNQSLTQLLTEKEWLVKEIHHRVKNNFHMVMGLLATQSEFLKNPEAIDAMRESRHRIRAMSLIHQKLYQSENLSTISMPEYIHELVSYLRESFDIPGTVQFRLDIDRVELDLSHVIPLGLILNEAITNAIKYAFPGGRQGIIEISLKELQGSHLLVSVIDDGIGLTSSPEKAQQSMGMKLMKGLSEDIDASLDISGDRGTAIRIKFYSGPEKNGES